MDVSTSLQNMQSFLASYGLVIGTISLIPSIIYGIFTAKLAGKKGYRGYFFTGFFFTIIGLLYVIGLPLERDAA
jgi:hypothetical protein